jgi:hypothetical protein
MVRQLLVLGGALIALSVTSCQLLPGSTGGNLTITYDDGEGNVAEWTLTCNPPGGTHPDPEAACRALEENGEQALPPVSPTQRCTMIYGGPQTATVTGTWGGEEVDAEFSRTNGCEIHRWKSLAGLLPKH